VRRIVNVASDALLPPPPLVRGIRGELLIAVVPFGEEVYLLIDVENVLSDVEKVELSEAHLSEAAALATSP
jgi:chemotaxis signal transduction protein